MYAVLGGTDPSGGRAIDLLGFKIREVVGIEIR
jgi:hypothetical protein